MSYPNEDRMNVEKQSWYQFYGQQMKAANKDGWHAQPDPGKGVILTLKEADALQAKLDAAAAETVKVEMPADAPVSAPTSGTYTALPSSGAAYVSSGTGIPACGGASAAIFCHNSNAASAPVTYTTSGSAVYPWQFAAPGSGAYPWQFASSGSAAYPWKSASSGSAAGSGSGLLGYGIGLI